MLSPAGRGVSGATACQALAAGVKLPGHRAGVTTRSPRCWAGRSSANNARSRLNSQSTGQAQARSMKIWSSRSAQVGARWADGGHMTIWWHRARACARTAAGSGHQRAEVGRDKTSPSSSNMASVASHNIRHDASASASASARGSANTSRSSTTLVSRTAKTGRRCPSTAGAPASFEVRTLWLVVTVQVAYNRRLFGSLCARTNRVPSGQR